MVRKAGIRFFAYMMIGIPHETKEEMFATVDFAKKLKPDYAQFPSAPLILKPSCTGR